jgi:ketosteroid isomerase-like protein
MESPEGQERLDRGSEESRKALEQELIGLENEWMDAVRRRDMEFLERLLADEFTLTTGRPGAEVRSRREYLEIARDRYLIECFDYEELDVHVYGDAALIRSRYRQRARMDDLDRTTTYLMTDVWARRGGCWQVVTRHVSPLTPP